MTINLADNVPRNSYDLAAGATQQVFTVDFEFFDDADLNVYIDGVLKTLTSDYLTADNNDVSARTVHTSGTDGFIHFTSLITGAAGNSTIVITREIDIERVTDFPSSGPFDIGSLNTGLDRLTAISADLNDEIKRSIRLVDYDASVSLTIPEAATRAGKFIAFDSTGAAIAASQGSWQGNWSSGYTYAQGDLIKDTSDGSIYIANTSHTSSGSQPISSNADAAKWDQLIDLASVTTSENNAASSATAAAGSATAAAASALNAAFSDDWAVKTDGVVNDGVTTDYSSKAYAIGGTGVTDSSGRGSAKEWATDTTNTCDGTEFSAKEYSIGTGDNTGMNTGSAKQWSIGGGTGFDRDTAVTGSGGTAEYSAKYWANQAKNETQTQRDVYYGAFTNDAAAETYQTGAAPTGNAGTVDAGDLYFDSSNNILRVYDGTNWNDAAADTTSFATNGFSIAMAIAL